MERIKQQNNHKHYSVTISGTLFKKSSPIPYRVSVVTVEICHSTSSFNWSFTVSGNTSSAFSDGSSSSSYSQPSEPYFNTSNVSGGSFSVSKELSCQVQNRMFQHQHQLQRHMQKRVEFQDVWVLIVVKVCDLKKKRWWWS
ncbi:hypothetical protein Ahy_B10g105925 isoform E [Arachis hypogaea]|uniref:Uncharacterized protein n=1 Tax=Arachis hypogaea TaxID=3818 RepID=A0A444X9A1_ARAHY|nr:hypothetical protein Ahy_B10g105925 isoform E [Arachis hypogaea]